MKRAALIMSICSGRGEQAFFRALNLLNSLEVPIRSTYPPGDPVRLPEAVRRAIAEEHDLIILGGGDGVVSSVVDLLIDSRAGLGFIPLGSANNFARTLGIPTDFEKACETIAWGRLVDVELGLAGDHHYVNVASVGMSADLASPHPERAAITQEYSQQEPFAAGFAFPDGDHEPIAIDGLIHMAVGNGRFLGGGMEHPALEVYAVEAGGPPGFARLGRDLGTEKLVHSERVHHWQTGRIWIATEPRLPVILDDMPVCTTPEHFSLVPGALKVLVPQGPPAAHSDTPHQHHR